MIIDLPPILSVVVVVVMVLMVVVEAVGLERRSG
jgi:hypothetical protein